MNRSYKPLVFVVLLVALGALAAILPLRDWLDSGVLWIEAHRELSWAVYVGAYIVATVLLIPGSVITLVAGFVFGLPLGVALVSVGSVLGASSAFLTGRFFARDWVERRIERLPRFSALDSATRHQGFTIVLLARLSPLFPFNLLNYALGVTAVRFRDYFFASWIGMLPGTVLYVYFGTVAQDLAALSGGQFDGGWFSLALLVAGLVATLLLVVVITRKATHTLGTHLQREAEGSKRR
ncbi:TVP38/TMEM64 family protein [Candidatus Rariloculus sp.]|uniref:TVP38/TMEM64 family protein n=1 Tax=Candidatus Rariloculus sp. TaxID=3101265 RepID=UPI003D11774D